MSGSMLKRRMRRKRLIRPTKSINSAGFVGLISVVHQAFFT
ncbi:hypothetical protein ESCAB7627_4026 [Escherichia albertii TW07627]|uniref:Uncharacterized protein n=1 Tax=Escherichia albertii (strain TW07627) TaxID=502347 RepID=A0ABC9NJM5_ESCAT|nr:hypothetical protein ESCAB7627_4026 [Escherichia albertii TW07627]